MKELTAKEAYEKCLELLEGDVEMFAIRVNRNTADAYFSYGINQIKKEVKEAEKEGIVTEDFYDEKRGSFEAIYNRLVTTLLAMSDNGLIKSPWKCYKEQMRIVFEKAKKLPQNDDTKVIIQKLSDIKETQRNEKQTRNDFYLGQLKEIQKINMEIDEIIRRNITRK